MKTLFFAFLMGSAILAVPAQTQTEATIEGLDGRTAKVSTSTMKQMPRNSVTVTDPKTKAEQHYEGVLLSEVLGKVDAPTGKTLHGVELRDYVEVIASDDYRVVFSLAELDQPTHSNKVLLADTLDGQPLNATQGPFKLIAPEDTRPERWVRMVSRIHIVQAR